MPIKKDPKVIDPIRHPKVQGVYERNANKRYEKMLESMVKMLTVGLHHSMK